MFVVRDFGRHGGQPDKARQPLTHPQLAMMHFVYEIRVTLSTKILMFSGLATTLLAPRDEVIAASCGGERKAGKAAMSPHEL
jgi:hypothetical protein